MHKEGIVFESLFPCKLRIRQLRKDVVAFFRFKVVL